MLDEKALENIKKHGKKSRKGDEEKKIVALKYDKAVQETDKAIEKIVFTNHERALLNQIFKREAYHASKNEARRTQGNAQSVQKD